jgi:hypothetical protein
MIKYQQFISTHLKMTKDFYVIFYQIFCNGIHNLKQNLVSQGSGFAGGNGSDGRQSEHGTFVFTDPAADAFLQINLGQLDVELFSSRSSHTILFDIDRFG